MTISADDVPIPTPTPHLAAFRRGSTGWLVLNRPERRNALSAEMWRAIPALVQRFSDDVNVRSIALTGAGDEAFAAGADISEFAANRDDAEAARRYDAMTLDSFAALLDVIDGYCIGGGLALALACDIRIASNRSIFALPPARLGLAYPRAGLSQLLAAVSAASAKELLFTARRIDAAEALRIGLVQAVAAPASLPGRGPVVAGDDRGQRTAVDRRRQGHGQRPVRRAARRGPPPAPGPGRCLFRK